MSRLMRMTFSPRCCPGWWEWHSHLDIVRADENDILTSMLSGLMLISPPLQSAVWLITCTSLVSNLWWFYCSHFLFIPEIYCGQCPSRNILSCGDRRQNISHWDRKKIVRKLEFWSQKCRLSRENYKYHVCSYLYLNWFICTVPSSTVGLKCLFVLYFPMLTILVSFHLSL